MSQDQGSGLETTDPELAHILVTGECGHHFPVPLTRLEDGLDFVCPACSAIDRFDDDARAAARDEIAKLKANGQLNETGMLAERLFSRARNS